ncbi:MAG: hypothetical protein GY797_18565 [Deltaproteobacteria bacterium]|nr:hypothetical protein [Deltaproteobacteria bacterium]
MEGTLIKAREQLELNVWRTSGHENTYSSYQNYLEKYPSGRHAQEAVKTIEKIAENESSLITRSLRENILLYFNRKELSNNIDHELQLEGISFQDLKHRMGLFSGGVDIDGGRSIPHPGSSIQAEFLNKKFIVNGIADGKGGFAVITEILVSNGVTVTTVKVTETRINSTKYNYSDGKWIRS